MLISYRVIGRNIRAARKLTGWTQEHTARLLGITPLHYGRLERGERPASLEQLACISKTLSTSLPELLRGCIEGESFGAQTDPDTLTIGQTIASIAQGCSAQAQALMVELCKTVAQSDRASDLKK